MKIDNSYFGGFIVSKNVIDKHQPIRYSFREKSLYDKLNGWTIYSAAYCGIQRPILRSKTAAMRS